MPTPASGSPASSAASPSPSPSPTSPLSDEARAATLWTFLQAQAPRFSLADASEVVRSLSFDPREDHKALAKRLRKALQARGIALKHVNSLHAAAQLAGGTSWHTSRRPAKPALRFHVFDSGHQMGHSEFGTWSELAVALRTWVDKLLARGQIPLGVLTMSFTGRSLQFSVPVPKDGEGAGRNEMWPMGGVTPLDADDGHWLADAPASIEKLRRHLEETGRAVLDGYAVLYLCANSHDRRGDVNAVGPADVVNSELVLLREPDEDDPHSGFEIARGDELTCWHQLELSLREGGVDRPPADISFVLPVEGAGAWYVNGVRYVWALETLKPHEYVPGRVHRQLGIPDCDRLLRRYKLAKRIHSGGFRHHDMTKRVDYLGGPPETWRVSLNRLQELLAAANLSWDSYLDRFDVEPVAMTPELPVGFVMQMLEDLEVEEPNKVFAWPALTEMALVADDRLLCSLMPRVDAVRYVRPQNITADVAARLLKAVDEFAGALQVQKVIAAGGLSMENELPYLVYANDAQELRVSVQELGMQMYVAVAPHLHSAKGLLPDVPGVKTRPWAFGHALLVRLVHAGEMQ